MNVAFRCVLTLLVFVATFYFVFWMGGALIVSFLPPLATSIVSPVAAVVMATAVAVYIWKGTSEIQRGLITSMVTGAFIVGGIGFIAGFFGPIVLSPESNQGPLLGLFITGPLGFVFGAIGGAIHWIVWGRNS